MLETAEIGRRVDKESYRQRVPDLRFELVQAQYRLREAEGSVLVAISGDDRPSCNEVLNLLHEWMDPRFLTTNAYGGPSPEEGQLPLFWRYWAALPPRGQVGLFVRGWTMQAITMRLLDRIDDGGLDRLLGRVRRFEKALANDGTRVIKFWMHLPEKTLKKRLAAAGDRPELRLGIRQQDQSVFEDYDRARRVVEHALRTTSHPDAPWTLVESADERYRNLTVAESLLGGMRAAGEQPAAPPAPSAVRPPEVGDPITVLDRVDLSLTIDKPEYEKKLDKLQGKLYRLSHRALKKGLSAVLVFEGWDAAGKGGIIRRLTAGLDAFQYRVVPVSAPTDEERAHHYLWRFWRQLPRAGYFTIFDRSWYGRVLVERVEGLAREEEWRRAYGEINDFEEQLVDAGIVLLKFWLHIDRDEQLRRFRAREENPHKRHKITADDWRNRERWDEYERAANEMIERTSADLAPWTLVPANDKRYARIHALRTVCERLAKKRKRR